MEVVSGVEEPVEKGEDSHDTQNDDRIVCCCQCSATNRVGKNSLMVAPSGAEVNGKSHMTLANEHQMTTTVLATHPNLPRLNHLS